MQQSATHRTFWILAGCAVLVTIGLFFVSRRAPSKLSAADRRAAVRKAFSNGDYGRVQELANDQDDPDVAWYAGRAGYELGDFDAAIAEFQLVQESASAALATEAGLQIVMIYQELKKIGKAADTVESLVKRFPDHLDVRRRAATVLDLAGRRREANVHHLKLVTQNQYLLDDLVLLADRHEPYAAPQIEEALRSPESVDFLLTRAMIAWRSGELSAATHLLRECLSADSTSVEANALLGLVLLDKGDMSLLAAWNGDLSANADTHPDVWYVRGAWAEQIDKPSAAIACYHKAVRLDPDFRQAIYRLSVAGADVFSDVTRKQFERRIRSIDRYRVVCKSIFFKGGQPELVVEASDLAESLGRFHEAIAWASLPATTATGVGFDIDRIARLAILAEDEDGHEFRWDYEADLPGLNTAIPSWPTVETIGASVSDAPLPVMFLTETIDGGLKFDYQNGAGESGRMIREAMGGGVAVLDLDKDLWPDVFFPQGQTIDGTHTDGLFRNVGFKKQDDQPEESNSKPQIATQPQNTQRSFERVDEQSRCGDIDYSHGAAIGDVNNDGFPDVYVANAGTNRLYINNGDGTFSSNPQPFDTKKWTISCAIVDLNDDGMPELFDVNYLEWGLPFTVVCNDSELGVPRTCPPERFAGERNEIYLNAGDGQFRNTTKDSGFTSTGKSLGVVAADFGGNGRIDLFVANDQVPNSWLTRDATDNGVPHFINDAESNGLAVNGTGEALACMGIASADINHDGLLDLFVTNFYRQPNTLYVATEYGGYRDDTGQAGLAEPGLLKLGFGTQFLDGNLDGERDLIVANGHLDDFSHKQIPFEMNAQLFINHGRMQFVESAPTLAGPYFEQRRIGRGLAVLDWNRDGRDDFSVSHLGSPAALLTNQSERFGHYISLRLVGRSSARDPIGARVKLTTARFTRWGHVTAGDGYGSSNQRKLTFGLASESVAQSVLVEWPSGKTQLFKNVNADIEYVAIEGSDRLAIVPR